VSPYDLDESPRGDEDAMTDTGAELRQTSDDVLRNLDALSALEEQKRSVQPDDPRLVALAKEVETLAAKVLASAVRQRNLATDLNDDPAAAAATPPIEEQTRPAAEILKSWRDAERALAAAEPGSADEATARAAIEQCREEYRQAFESRAHAD
jgi:hypothetical protein